MEDFEKTEYNYLCRKCEHFFSSHHPMAACPDCHEDADVLCISSVSHGKHESSITDPDFGINRLISSLEIEDEAWAGPA